MPSSAMLDLIYQTGRIHVRGRVTRTAEENRMYSIFFLSCSTSASTPTPAQAHTSKRTPTSSTVTSGLEKVGITADVLAILLLEAAAAWAWHEVFASRALLPELARNSGRRKRKAVLMLKRRLCCTKESSRGSRKAVTPRIEVEIPKKRGGQWFVHTAHTPLRTRFGIIAPLLPCPTSPQPASSALFPWCKQRKRCVMEVRVLKLGGMNLWKPR